MKREDIKTVEDLERFLGKEKMSKLFLEHYLMLVGQTLINAKEIDLVDLLALDKEQ